MSGRNTAGAIAVALEKSFDIPHQEIYSVLVKHGAVKALMQRSILHGLSLLLLEDVQNTQKEIANAKNLCREAWKDVQQAENALNAAFTRVEANPSEYADHFADMIGKHVRTVRYRAVLRERLRTLEGFRGILTAMLTAPKHEYDPSDILAAKWIDQEIERGNYASLSE